MCAIDEKLKQYMKNWSEADRFSGTVLVCHRGQELFKNSYGYENYQYKIKNTEATVYKIGSYTKQFTAVAILMLYEEGRINLDDNIGKYIPEYTYSDGVTAHHLLSHTSGIPEHTNFDEYSARERISFDIILDRLSKRALNFVPGDRFEYSNSNYVLLGRIVEVVSKLDIEVFYKKHIFEPIGLGNTGVSKNEDIVPNLAMGYSYSGQGIINADFYDMSGAFGSGFIYSNAGDLIKWINGLLGGKIITSATLKRMLSSYGYAWYLDADAGYGCFVKGNPANEICASGLISGYVISTWVNLNEGSAVILCSNNDTNPLERVLKGIKSILSGEEASVEIRPVIGEYMGNLGVYKNLAGNYRCQYTGGEFNISLDDKEIYVDRLWAQEFRGKKYRLGYVEETSEKIIYACEICEGKFTFIKNPDGSVREAYYLHDVFTLPYKKIR